MICHPMQKGILTVTKQLSPIITVWTMYLDLLYGVSLRIMPSTIVRNSKYQNAHDFANFQCSPLSKDAWQASEYGQLIQRTIT